MSKQITRGDEARQAILRGIDRLANAVKVTLGPRGRNVILETASGSPTITKDGATVAREIVLTTLEIVEGMQFDRGYLSPYFVTDPETMEVVLERPFVLLHEGRIRAIADLLPLLETAAASGRPLLIVAEDVEGDVLATLVVNKLRGTLPVAAVKAPGFGDRRKAALEDIAVLTGGRAITEDLGVTLKTVALEELGTARRITIGKDKTTIVEGGGTAAAIEGRLKQLRVHAERADSEYDRDTLREQIATLSGGVAVIRVGATTESELKERKARVEDAIHAAKAAVAEGVVPGGGVALLRASAALDGLSLEGDRQAGVRIVRRAIEEPLRWIAANAGHEPAVVADRVKNLPDGSGFNARSEAYENLMDAGVIDPVKVVRIALQNAASVASLLLTMEAAISQDLSP